MPRAIPFKLQCPHCGHQFYRRMARIEGRWTPCPKCKAKFKRSEGVADKTTIPPAVKQPKKRRGTVKTLDEKWLKSKEFLKSDEWRTIRYQALKLHGAACQCCGRTAAHGIVLHVDHIKPRSLYPHLALELSNLQVLCEDCNLGKSNIDDTDWRFNREESDKALARHDDLNDEFRSIIAGIWHKHTPSA